MLLCLSLALADEYHDSAVRSAANRHRRAAPVASTVQPTEADNGIPSHGENIQQGNEYMEGEEPCEEENVLDHNRTKKKSKIELCERLNFPLRSFRVKE